MKQPKPENERFVDMFTKEGALSGRGLRMIGIGDEYFKDGKWHTVTSEKEQTMVLRNHYPIRNHPPLPSYPNSE